MDTTRAVGARRGFGCAAALFTGLVVFLVVSVISAALFVFAPNSNHASASFIHAQPGALPWDRQQRLTMMLMGSAPSTDSRPRTSMMMIVSFDPKTGQSRLLSLPENLWVTIPGFGPGILSEAYHDGGARLAMLTVQSVTHVAIPYYAVIGSDTFRQIVDAMGGITIQWTKTTTDWSGYQHQHRINRRLDGAAAISYAYSNSRGRIDEMTRMHHQQQILLAVQARAGQPQIFFQIPSIVNTFGGSIDTNYPYTQIPGLARMLQASSGPPVQQDVVGYGNYAVTDYSDGGQHVLLPNWNRIRAIAQAMFADRTLKTIPVEVQNGAGIDGAASTLASWLRQAGVHVTRYASARSFSYAHTQVVLNASASPQAVHVARAVATLLETQVEAHSVAETKAPIVVIIGQDFQDPSQQ